MPKISDEERERRARSVAEAARSGELDGKPPLSPELRPLFDRYVEGEIGSAQLIEGVRRWHMLRQAIASWRLEGAELSEDLQGDLGAFARGELTPEQVVARTRARLGLPADD
ncbi:hypothetical protein GCM10022286_00350 [Gryllotalpicola daejeonensis]|uniref:Antitoxin VbhA domain-containing protein n=1 Tax=Gryllotalpicola daejeonensis TaxID=993087 RepID=A0ABP7ZCM7_9MICO